MNLKIMLDTAETNCTIKNRSIYEEHGGLTFKIRFNSIDNRGQSLNGMCGSFARKSPSKLNRDKKRATQGVVTRSQNKENLEESIEKPRANITGEDKTYFISLCHVSGDLETLAMDCNHASPMLPAVKSIISVRRVTVDAGYVMTVTKPVPIMDIINGLKKEIIPAQ